jgi:hypothetical protein
MEKVRSKYTGGHTVCYETVNDMSINIARSCSSETSLEQDKETAMYVDKALLSGLSVERVTSIVTDTTPENHKRMIGKLLRLSILKKV